MSGIAAIIRTDGGTVEPGAIAAMTAAMAYRGPDGISHWVEGPVALGHCMARTTTESLEETQPLANENQSIVLVMDGYLTNWEELRSDLLQRGARLRNRSDAELVLRAYEEWGQDCPRHIDGEYAFVIWDERRREAFCAKDHQGLRPLDYHWDGKRLVIASDIAGVMAALPHRPAINHGYMAEIMANEWLTADETVWAGVMRLLPAHSMRLSDASLHFAEYWTLPIEVSITYATDEDYAEHYRQMFAECVRRASRSHQPVAFEVSGGLDSSALFAMAQQLQGQGLLPAPTIRGYTLAGPPGSLADEVEFARAVARHYSAELTEAPLHNPGLDWFARQAAEDRDVPIFPNGAMAMALHQRMVADGCRVCISGVGGDQWLDGRDFHYLEQLLLRNWRVYLASLKMGLAHKGWRKTGLLAAKAGLRTIAPRPALAMYRDRRDRNERNAAGSAGWLSADMRRELIARRQRWQMRAIPESPWLYKLGILKDPYLTLVTDMLSRHTAKLQFELRFPLLSRSFIELSAATPEWTRRRGPVKKVIHRKAMASLLPEQVAQRRTKATFDDSWRALDGEMNAFLKGILPEALEQGVSAEGLAGLKALYCGAAIDSAPDWEVWGLFAYAQLLIASDFSHIDGD